jgi:hypothetical protein
MYIRPLGNHYMMSIINKWRWHYIIFPIKRMNIAVYQNHMLKNIDSMKKVDGHQDPPRSINGYNNKFSILKFPFTYSIMSLESLITCRQFKPFFIVIFIINQRAQSHALLFDPCPTTPLKPILQSSLKNIIHLAPQLLGSP